MSVWYRRDNQKTRDVSCSVPLVYGRNGKYPTGIRTEREIFHYCTTGILESGSTGTLESGSTGSKVYYSTVLYGTRYYSMIPSFPVPVTGISVPSLPVPVTEISILSFPVPVTGISIPSFPVPVTGISIPSHND